MIPGSAMKQTVLVLMLFAALASPRQMWAKEGAISVSPSVVTLRGEAGQSTRQTLTFTNGSSHPFAFEMQAQDAVVRDGKRQFVAAGTLPGSIAATAVFSQKVFTVAARQTVRIDVTVTIPPRPPVRAIAIVCRGTTKLGTGPLPMTASVGTLLTFTLTGDVIAATASPLKVQPPTASANLVATQLLANSGSAPLVATGVLAILDSRGSLAGKQAIPARRLLPGEKADVRVEYGGDLPAGRYRAMVTYDLTDKTLTSGAEFDVQ
jgi:hypothetical protein